MMAAAYSMFRGKAIRLIFGLRDASEKIEGLAFVLSNSKNISYVAFLKYKNSRKQETGTVASC
jgi:hypothetical protein